MVEDYVRSIEQKNLNMGASDPRLNTSGNIDVRLQQMLSCYSKKDPPPNRVKPVPVQVIHRIFAVAATLHHDPQHKCLAVTIGLAFFFLLRPGEYDRSPSNSSLFQLCDVQLF